MTEVDLEMNLQEVRPPSKPEDVRPAKNVTFDFSLVSERNHVGATSQQFQAIQAAFPGCHTIITHAPFVILSFDTKDLPPKPAPAILSDRNPLDFVLCGGVIGHGPSIEVAPSPVRGTRPTHDIFNAIEAVFKHDFNCDIVAIDWWTWRMVIIVSANDGDVARLPYSINGMIVQYSRDPAMSEPALRRKLPTTDDPNGSQHPAKDLRPGIMLSSGGHEHELLTTSSIPLRGPDGARYFTGANQGVLGVGSSVFHPDRKGTKIGEVKSLVPNTDIALVALEEGFKYARQPFISEYKHTPILTNFRRTETLRIGNHLHLDSPFSGDWAATFLFERYAKFAAETPAKNEWIESAVALVDDGNGQGCIPPGICGSAVWDDQGEVVGFLQFEKVEETSPLGRRAYIVSALPLIEMGMEIAAIE
ncbi:MAG: hypothetical protein M4579_000854 [Chaenotheca gracillima]|nr:MAG: hypothetical protein M4579_000854 [Chaenotheca gracillima]